MLYTPKINLILQAAVWYKRKRRTWFLWRIFIIILKFHNSICCKKITLPAITINLSACNFSSIVLLQDLFKIGTFKIVNGHRLKQGAQKLELSSLFTREYKLKGMAVNSTQIWSLKISWASVTGLFCIYCIYFMQVENTQMFLLKIRFVYKYVSLIAPKGLFSTYI